MQNFGALRAPPPDLQNSPLLCEFLATRQPHPSSFFDENELDVNEGVFKLMKLHISILGEEIRQYFPDLEDFQK